MCSLATCRRVRNIKLTVWWRVTDPYFQVVFRPVLWTHGRRMRYEPSLIGVARYCRRRIVHSLRSTAPRDGRGKVRNSVRQASVGGAAMDASQHNHAQRYMLSFWVPTESAYSNLPVRPRVLAKSVSCVISRAECLSVLSGCMWCPMPKSHRQALLARQVNVCGHLPFFAIQKESAATESSKCCLRFSLYSCWSRPPLAVLAWNELFAILLCFRYCCHVATEHFLHDKLDISPRGLLP